MNELEVYQAMLGTIENAQSTGEMMVTLMTGYLLIAFFIGGRLSTFQVLFVNAAYLMLYSSAASTLVYTMGRVTHFGRLLDDIGSSIPSGTGTASIQNVYSTPIFLWLVPLLVVSGSFYFMWTIRQPKPE